jgi:serine/threonine protein kinase
MPTRRIIPAGTLVRDTYTVDAHLASGNFSDVYRVRHRYMGMQAMKVLRDSRTEEQRVEGLLEAFRLARISHPSIVRVFDGNRLDPSLGGDPYVTMELVDGEVLGGLGQGSCDDMHRDLLDAAEQVAAALAHAHGLDPPILHRDVKPGNILTRRDRAGRFEAKLADFGLAIPIDPELGVAAAGGAVVYRSPESLDGFEVLASDVYSFGLSLYEAVTGVLPHRSSVRGSDGNDLLPRLRSARKEPIPPPSHFRHLLHPAVDAVILRCLTWEVRPRIQDGASLLEAVRAMRQAVERDPSPSEPIRLALAATHESDALARVVPEVLAALRSDPGRGPAYARLLSFLQAEARRRPEVNRHG